MVNRFNTEEILVGSVEEITFRKEDTGFTVLELGTGQELISVVGIIPHVFVGEQLKLTGQYEMHPSFGMQFKAESCERSLPTTSAAILRYLSSGAIKGVGPATARKLVEAFGGATLDVLEKTPEQLHNVNGITPRKAREIAEEFARQFGVREVVIQLQKYNILPDEALRIYKTLGGDAPHLLEENPYLLCSDEIGLSFDRADEIGVTLQKPADAPGRLKAGIIHILRHNLNNGHTCLPRKKLAVTAARLLEMQREEVEQSIGMLLEEKAIILKETSEEDLIFLPALYNAEIYTANRIRIMLQVPPEKLLTSDGELKMIETETGVQYDKQQREAIYAALEQGIVILTGGPGTGKTTTLNAIIKLMQYRDFDIALAAPTGRAAKRMSELTGMEAKTLHRLLEVEWSSDHRAVFNRNERNPLDHDVIIVDELSMIDILLFEALLRAMPLGCRLILVGDSDQLPSVGAGNVLGDLIEADVLPVVKLQKIFRQAMQSLIVTNAHKIVAGEEPEFTRKDGDFFMIRRHHPSQVVQTVMELCLERLPAAYNFSPFTDIQILCPSKKRESGTSNLNNAMQSLINPPSKDKKQMKRPGFLLRERDKVMQIKNNYDIPWNRPDGSQGSGVFNGDVGILESIDLRRGVLCVRFDDRIAMYSPEESEDLELAYAMTIHKSQGSEFECVVLPLMDIPPRLRYRNLLYTAVTRAKKLLLIVGDGQTVLQMVRNNKRSKRYTALQTLLKEFEE